ncbi:MAG: two component regulator three y domain-containing protein [Cyclobacteriaceae bacterium]|nr:two component regulator three y domain-containing protein [Cyclobacteriaceae bacterium]
MRFLFILITCCIGFYALNAQSKYGGIPFVRNFSTITYRAGIQNWAIVQDARGLVYIANNFGLLEFDGNHWGLYTPHNASKMRSVTLDGSGRIYVGCQGEFGYFFPNKNGQLEYTSLADSLPDQFRNFDETWSVFLDDGKAYFCTFTNIFVYDDDSISVVQPENLLELSFFVNRELLVNERGKGLTRLENNELKLIKGGDFFKDISISSILPAFNGHYLISTFQHGIYFLDRNGNITPWNNNRQAYFSEAIVNCMIRLKNGNYAAGTQNNGLLILDEKGEELLQLTSGRGLDNRTVLSVMEDDLHNLWIGNNNGLAYVELGSPFTFLNEETGLPGTGYTAYLDDANLYLGTNTGLYLKNSSGTSEPYTLIEGMRGQVYHIGRYRNDLLVGHHNGAFRIDGKHAELLSSEPGGWIFLSLDNSPKLIEGVYNGIQFLSHSNGHWSFSKKPSGYRESSRVMEQDRDGYLWITHGYKGVFKLDLDVEQEHINSVEFYGKEKGFRSNLLINVFRIRNDLVFTSEQGVYKYDKREDRFIPEPLFSGLLGDNVVLWCIREDALGNIYFMGEDYIGVMKKNSVGGYDLETSIFNKVRHFLNDDLQNIVILNNNEVLFGAKEGFIHYDPALKINRKPGIKSHIRRFSTTSDRDSVLFYGNFVNNGNVAETQTKEYVITLPYRNNSVNFTFAATSSFESDAELMHQYYLSNFDKGWSEWTTQTQKEYTNLREGTYVFHVRSRNVYGELSNETLYRFKILPPWYRTAWAYTGYGVFVFAFLFTGFGLLDRKYKHERKLMTLKQRKELIRKDNEMETLAQKNREEITRLKNEKLEAELLHMNKELGTSTMLILNKNEFISKMKDNLKGLVDKSDKANMPKELSRIVHDIEGNLSSDTDWEHFQVHFDNVHGDFSRRLRTAYPQLSPQEMKLSAYLRMNLSTKEIAHLLNISVRGVEISRYRLRKKLGLDRKLNLQEFILKF